MAWPEQRIESWQHFTRVAQETARAGSGLPSYICRGVSDSSWTLQPSLVRLLAGSLDANRALSLERHALDSFMAEAHLHLPMGAIPPSLPAPGIAEWWALMQHYSAPTRLLDWTYSLYVAAFFAVAADWDQDGAIYLVQGNALLTAMNERYGEVTTFPNTEFVSPDAQPRLTLWTPARKTDRIVAQQGTFTVALGVLTDHGAVINEALNPMQTRWQHQVIYRKLIIPRAFKPEFTLHLRHMNIASHSLFPGADGLGRTIADLVRVARAVEFRNPGAWTLAQPDAAAPVTAPEEHQ